MSRRYYSSTAVSTTLTAGINSAVTSLTVASTTGYPVQYPFTIVVDQDTGSEEVMSVTGAAGTTFTVTRGVDGTSAVAHSAGAVVRHGVSARDFDESNAHVNASSGVHGVSGSVVDTLSSQVLSSKTLDSPALTGLVNGASATSFSLPGDVSIDGVTVGDPWSSWTPTLGGSGWSLGAGSATGKWTRIGKTAFFRASLTFGSGFTAGSATPYVGNLPFTPKSDWDVFPIQAIQNGGAAVTYCFARYIAGGLYLYMFNGQAFATNVPLTWASGDVIRFSGALEVA